MNERVLLLSVRPRFAGLILDGHKTVELRRVTPRVAAGQKVLLYSSSPIRALVGSCVISRLVVDSPRAIWTKFGRQAAVARAEFDAYFGGTQRGTAICITCVRRMRRPVSLEGLRAVWPGFMPPRSFRYLESNGADQNEAGRILRLARATGQLGDCRDRDYSRSKP